MRQPLCFRFVSLAACLVCLVFPASAQVLYEDYIYDPSIRSVQLYRDNDERSYPFLYLGDETPLQLEFDELVQNPGSASRFYVSFRNCDAFWNPSDLLIIEYSTGFSSYPITDWNASITTRIPYVHYHYAFSLSTFGLKRSGNYLLSVFRDGDEEHPVLTRRFIVGEKLVGVQLLMSQSYATAQRSRLQTLTFDVYPDALKAFDPASELYVVMMQNGRWDNASYGIKPTMVSPQKLQYFFDSALEFEGGNEFRMIDIRSTRFRTAMMQQIEDHDSVWYIKLFNDQERRKYAYTNQFDFNGAYVIAVQEYPNYDTQADYVMVRFALDQKEEFYDKDIYLTGRFTDWKPKSEYQLMYNPATRRYEAEVLLKQGIYDYKYVVVPRGEGKPDETFFEGSHFETENNYTILVYYKGVIERSHRLVGMAHVNYLDR